MKVSNMTSNNGNKIANQFIIDVSENGNSKIIFQSYNSVIAVKENGKITLDASRWDYSKTTGKYRNQFLNETRKETEAKIKNGTYILANLN